MKPFALWERGCGRGRGVVSDVDGRLKLGGLEGKRDGCGWRAFGRMAEGLMPGARFASCEVHELLIHNERLKTGNSLICTGC